MKCFSFKNLKMEEEEKILDKFSSKLKIYNTFYKCYFERNDEETFKVSVYVNNQWSPLYITAEHQNLDFLCDYTEDVLTEHLDKLKSTVKSFTNRAPEGFI